VSFSIVGGTTAVVAADRSMLDLLPPFVTLVGDDEDADAEVDSSAA